MVWRGKVLSGHLVVTVPQNAQPLPAVNRYD